VSRELPSFDLVVATVDRAEALTRFLDSLEAQRYPHARVLVVDQSESHGADRALEGRDLDILGLSSERGLSRARNEALRHLRADLVAFPDDDCTYPDGLLQRVAGRFSGDDALDGLTGRAEDPSGRSSGSWKTEGAVLTDDNLWNRAISFTVFLRRELVESIGPFDERLGLGSGEPWSSGEEIDYLVRAIRSGARIEYDPSLVVTHDVRADDERIGYRDGSSIGDLLRKHGYPAPTVARMLTRPVGGALVSLARLDTARARFHVATLRGRIRGLRASQGAT
jgi:glycosyltransferase involved in cell wall biosynthesis